MNRRFYIATSSRARQLEAGALRRICLTALSFSLSGLLAIATLVQASRAEDTVESVEYRVKAVVIYNFAKYVKWPSSKFTKEDDPMRLCFFGKNPFGNLFDDVKSKKAQERPIEVLQLDAPADTEKLKTCHVLYWTESENKRLESIAISQQKYGVLTVGEGDSKGIVRFVLKEGKVRFEIDEQGADSAGLAISSQLLKLAVPRGG